MNAVIQRKAILTDIGFEGLDTLTEEQFFAAGEELGNIEQGLQWAIGDWYNSIPPGKGNQYYGTDGKAKACQRVGLNPGTAENCGRVARIFATPHRSGALTFKHHYVLCHDDLTALDRRRLLSRAKKGDEGSDKPKPWTSSRLKKERDIVLGIAPPAPTEGFNNGINALKDSVIESLPKTVGAKTVNAVVRGLTKEAEKLRHEFTSAVEKEAEERAKIARANMKLAEQRANEQYDRALKKAVGVKAFMTRDEFQLIRACLHPDRNPHPKAAKAFDIFNRLADVKNW